MNNMKCLNIIGLFFVALMPFGHAKESTGKQKKQTAPVKIAENINKEAHELPYFRLPWMDENYDRWSQTKINRSQLSVKQIKALPSRVDNSAHKAWQGVGDQGRKNCC